jgi:hypothetical protein
MRFCPAFAVMMDKDLFRTSLHEYYLLRLNTASLLPQGEGHDCREKVRPGTGRETGLGHAGGRARQEQLPRMRGYEIRQLSCFDPLTLTLSLWERELLGQP